MIIPLTYVLISTFVSKAASSDFSIKGDPCSKFDSCFAKPLLRTCSCEEDCPLYGTCCHDFKKQHEDAPINSTYSCYSLHTASPVFAKRSCSDDFRGHIDFRLACFDGDEDEMDVQNNLLVTSHRTKITYWNKHCAICSNEAANDLKFWNIEVFCPKHKSVDTSVIRRNLTYDHDKKQWGLEVDGEFLQCIVKYAPPPFIDEVKHCPLNLITSCPVHYTNEDTVLMCSKYYAERKLQGKDVYYKNIHCAICNGADVTTLECPGMISQQDSIEESDFSETIDEVFTQGSWLDKEPAKSYECSEGFSYDPLRTKCRRNPYFSKINSPIPNSSSDYRINGLLSLAILFILLYLF